MTSHPRFDLEEEIRSWRQELAAAGLASEVLIELEEHVREDIERQMQSGVSAPEAFLTALRRLGRPSELRYEFDLIDRVGIGAALRCHKWKIMICAALGLGAGVVFQIIRPGSYESEAKLLIRHVLAEGPTTPVSPGSGLVLYGAIREEAMQREVEILSSLDLSRHVVEVLGPEKILARAGDDDDLSRATAVIRNGLSVSIAGGSSVIRLSFRHPDSALLQRVLRELIDQYLKLHVQAFRGQVPQVSNISLIQAPSPPYADSVPFFRLQVTLMLAGLFVGFAWALLARLMEPSLRLAR